MGIPSEAAKLPTPPSDEGALGAPTMPSGGDGTFEGTVDTNLYGLTLADMKNKRSANKFKNNEMRDQIVWLFTIDGLEDRGTIAVYSSYSLHEKSSLLPVLAALGKTQAEGEKFEKSKYLGSKCKGFVEMKKSKTSDNEYARITKLVKA